MKKVLILCAHRPGRSPSQRYRFEQYLDFLEQHGYAFEFSYLLSEKDDQVFYSEGRFLSKIFILKKSLLKRLRDWVRFNKFDIVFIQREAWFLGSSFFEKCAARSKACVIFDFDDSIWMADTSPGNLRWEWLKKPAKFFTNVALADYVIAGNKYLEEVALPYTKNLVVIPTTIDTDLHFPMPQRRNGARIVIGWSGSISTLKHFEMLVSVLKKIKEHYKEKVGFKIIGQTNYINSELEVESVAWSASSEVYELNSFDIGLMPLPDNEWAKGKCGLKGLSYMACGVPAIMSAVGVNTEIIRHGENGFLAHNENDWFELLCRLIDSKDLRNNIGAKGRATVQTLFSVEANKHKYLKVFNNVTRS